MRSIDNGAGGRYPARRGLVLDDDRHPQSKRQSIRQKSQRNIRCGSRRQRRNDLHRSRRKGLLREHRGAGQAGSGDKPDERKDEDFLDARDGEHAASDPPGARLDLAGGWHLIDRSRSMAHLTSWNAARGDGCPFRICAVHETKNIWSSNAQSARLPGMRTRESAAKAVSVQTDAGCLPQPLLRHCRA